MVDTHSKQTSVLPTNPLKVLNFQKMWMQMVFFTHSTDKSSSIHLEMDSRKHCHVKKAVYEEQFL